MTSDLSLPGRLGDPDLTLGTDPRADPRMVATLEPLGLAGRADPVPLGATSSIEDIRAVAAAGEPASSRSLTLFSPVWQLSPV